MKIILALIATFVLGCQLHAQVSFIYSSTPNVGSSPYGLVAVDVNGDGKPDLICANGASDTLTVLTNNGNDGFVLSSSPVVGNEPTTLVEADINGDGKPDLITSTYTGNTLSVLTNNGSGGFVTAGTYAVGSGPQSVVAADVNGDGMVDLICANENDNTLSVLTNNGSGGFVLASLPSVSGNPVGITAADVNGDGHVDLITANYSDNSLSVLTNNGTGKFVASGTYAVGNAPWSVVAADVNGDGMPDLICANLNSSTLSVLTNNGSGGFVTSGTYSVGSGPRIVTVADVNGDGMPDLICSDNYANTLSVLTNNGSGGFNLAGTFAVGYGPFGVTTADINGDHKPDIICANSISDTLSVLLNTTPGPVPIITNQPNGYVLYGQNTNLSVSVSSKPPVAFQWYYVPANNAGQAGAYAQTINGFVVGAVVTNGGFGYGNIPNVSFVGGGGSGAVAYASISNGAVTGITVTETGSGYASLPSVVIDAPNGFLIGQTNSTLAISNASQSSLGNYYVVVSNIWGSVTSSVVNLTLLYPPSIIASPSSVNLSQYGSKALSVSASGTPPLAYQWTFNGTNIVGANGSTYILTNFDIPNIGNYAAVVSNPYGSATSAVASVQMIPSLVSPFGGALTLWGQPATLNVGAVGSGTLNYQWYDNGVAIPGANGSSYTFDSIQFTNAGLYSVVVSSDYGSVTNTAYQVVVNPANVSLKLCANVVIQGTVGYTYIIQSTTDLSNTNSWMVETNLTLTAPIEYWDDTSVDVHTGPRKFYQVLPGQ